MEKIFEIFNYENYIIELDCEWKNNFDTCMLLIITYSCLTTVYYVSFDEEIS